MSKGIKDLNTDYRKTGQEIYALIKKLYPICRSITGNGVRQTLNIIKEHIPLDIKEVATGTKVFDWTVPKEWNIKDAYIRDPHGKKIVDFKKLNLHILNYSVPIHRNVTLKELRNHLFMAPDNPRSVPYLTSYYKENWGFCLTEKQFKGLKGGTYEVVIDSKLSDGHLTFGELYLKGRSKEEMLLSCYVCHPSMCNDNLSGVSLLTFIAKYLMNRNLNYSYRFLFIPETIGAITWLSLNEKNVSRIKYGLTATCLGDKGGFTYRKSRDGDALIDRMAEKALIDSGKPYTIIDFNPADGSDERQFSSPGFNLPVGSLMRTKYGSFPQYHSSEDNLSFVAPEYLAGSFQIYSDIIFILENNATYLNLISKGEPQLGRRGLYRTLGGKNLNLDEAAIFWVLNLSDGHHSLLDIALRSGLSFVQIKKACDILTGLKLLKALK